MKAKRLMLVGLSGAALAGVAGCNNATSSETAETKNTVSWVSPASYAQTFSIKNASSSSDGDEIIDFVKNVVSKGGDLIVGGVQAYAKTVVLNLLKECGLDFRDATTKTLEKIQEKLSVIESKIDAIAAREEQMHSETVLNNVLQKLSDAQVNYVKFVVKGLGRIASLENDPNADEKAIEQERLAFYKNTISKLRINGEPLVAYVTSLALNISTPSPSEPSKDIFAYYANTLGKYDVWSSLKTRNMRNFMAYVMSTLIDVANLAKFQMYYLCLGKDQSTIDSYGGMADDMAKAINDVNAHFKAVNESLEQYDKKKEEGTVIYMPSGKEYSLRMATLTFNKDDRDRQGLLLNSKNEKGQYPEGQFAYCYAPDQGFLGKVANDFKSYAGAYCGSDYTIKDYLKSVGFYSVNQDLFDKSIGLFNANFYADCHGFLHDDVEYTITYYNDKGDYARKAIYELSAFHNWNCYVTNTRLDYVDDSYYLCFALPDGSSQKLDGGYKSVYMYDGRYTVMDNLPYSTNSSEAYKKSNWQLHENW